jgi:hypothetical protein
MSDPRYAVVNALHARGYPPLTRHEAYRYAKLLLLRFGHHGDACASVGRDIDPARVLFEWGCRAPLGRRCWASTRPTTGTRKGWGRLIHDVGHMVHRYRHPRLILREDGTRLRTQPHATGEHAIETEIAYYVQHSTDWLTPVVVAKPDGLMRTAQANERDARSLTRWEAKRQRAERAIRKLKGRMRARQLRVMRRAGGEPQGAAAE